MKTQSLHLHYWTVPLILGTFSSTAFMGCRKSRFWDDQTPNQQVKSPPSSLDTNKNLQLTSSSTNATNGKVELNVIPLGSWGSFGAFWRAKNLSEEIPTSLLVFQDLLDSKDQTTGILGQILGERKEPAPSPTDEKNQRGLSQPEGIMFYIKKMEFISDENLLTQIPPGSKEDSPLNGRLLSGDSREISPWDLKLNSIVINELVALYGLPDDEIFNRLIDKVYTSPDELISDLEEELKDRGILVGDPTRVQKTQEILAKHLEAMTVEQAPIGEVAPLLPQGSALIQNQPQDAGSFGPFRIEMGANDTALIYTEGNNLKTSTSITLAPGLYRTVRVTWGAVAQVKGCVGVGQGTLCTRSSSSPYVTNISLRDFEANLPEFMDVPTINDDPKWPLSGDWIQEYGIDLDIKPGSVNRLSLLYPVAGSLRFHQTGHDQDLLPGMPRSRPYFYMPSLRERLMMTARPIGRLYDFSGTATLCEPQSNQAASDCTGTQHETFWTTLQIVTDSSGTPLRAIWQYLGGAEFIGGELDGLKRDNRDGFRTTYADPSLWLDFFSSEAGNRSQGSGGESREDETALWLRPAGSLGGDSRDLVRLEGLPVALDRWQVGETKTLWAKKTVMTPQFPLQKVEKEPSRSQGSSQGSSKGKSQKSRREDREVWARVQLQRVL